MRLYFVPSLPGKNGSPDPPQGDGNKPVRSARCGYETNPGLWRNADTEGCPQSRHGRLLVAEGTPALGV
jgi:hypothetical protein